MTDAARRAAAILRRHRLDGTKLEVLPTDCRPADLRAGYAVQAALVESERVMGWKIAATSSNGQRHIGVTAPVAGRLFATRVVADGALVSMAGNHMAAAECEFVFRMAVDLPPRSAPYTRAEVLAAVGGLHPGLELPDSRFRDFAAAGAAQIAADNACAHWMAIGPATGQDWRGVDLREHATSLRIDGELVSSGRGADVLGDPIAALVWLVDHCAAEGSGLLAGQFVTTGVTGAPTPIAAGQRVEADLGCFGAVTVQLVDRQAVK